ncbi:MAG: LmbE-like protein [Pseudonocardiales bacterium]|nr:LmbE-like protein [Pseudonocardiales bacterium]
MSRLREENVDRPLISRVQTIVSFHAHPDDEALLTGGTLALLASAGHRVVLVVATAGARGLSGDGRSGEDLAEERMSEVERSAQILGCARVVHLGFPDSGWTGGGEMTPAAGTFAGVELDAVAEQLAEILRAENADVLTVYDQFGGYGHADHVRVHDAGLRAAELAGTPRVLEATIDRTNISRAVRILRTLRLVPSGTATQHVPSWYTAREEITHRVPVRPFAAQKRAALACHRSQATGGSGPRTAAILLRLPRWVFARVCGTEWFVETGADVPRVKITDPLVAAPRVGSAQ